jgi:glycosyltransferase involved in cell wall biosynthesis
MNEKKSFHILTIAPTPFFADRGCHVRIYEEVVALEQLGHKVVICTYHIGRDLDNLKIERIMNIPWYRREEAGPSIHKLYLDMLLLLKTLSVGLKLKPDIIHAHLHEGALIGNIVGKILRVPVVFDHQGSLTTELIEHNFIKKNSFIYRFLSFVESRIQCSSSFIISSSVAGSAVLYERFGLKKSDICLLDDGVNISTFFPRQKNIELLQKLKLPPNKKIVVYLGYLHPYEGIDLLFEAFKKVVEQKKDVHFLVMGYPCVEMYKEVAEKLNIGSYVTFTGKISYQDAPYYLTLGDIAVSGKLSGSEGNAKLCNYMGCGLPSVVFDTATNRHILGKTGFYAEPGNVDAFANQIIKLLSSEEELQHLKSIIRRRAEEHFSWQKRAEKLTQIYEELINNY